MIDNKINLLRKKDDLYPRGKAVFKISRFILYLFVILLISFFVFSYQVLFTENSLTDIFTGKISILKQLQNFAGETQLRGEADDRINFMMLGMGGAGHDGPYLTDTIMLTSLKPSTGQVAMISVPRDLLVEIPEYGWWKINNANAFGEEQNPGNGSELTKQVIEKHFNFPIHYFVRIDFAGFEKLIDDIGGIKVFVDREFTDFQYPTKDHKYQVISFEQGWQTMDGDTALKFVRSRHGTNGENSDFARSKRQQKVIEAVKKRVLSYNFFLSPRKISKMIDTLSAHIRTDIEPWEMVQLGKMVEKINSDNIITQVIDDSPDGLLYAGIVNEAYVLQPKGGDFSQIQYLLDNIFKPEEKLEQRKIIRAEVRNGTTIPGLASTNAEDLKKMGFKILKIGNAPIQDYEKTVIYKLNENTELDQESGFLQNKYSADIITNDIPIWVQDFSDPNTDFFIVLGSDSNK